MRAVFALKWGFVVLFSAMMICTASPGIAAENCADPRILSRIQPTSGGFWFEVGSDGRTLHVLSSLRPSDGYILENYDISNPKQPVKLSQSTFDYPSRQRLEIHSDRLFIFPLSREPIGIVEISHPNVIKEVPVEGRWSRVQSSDDGELLAGFYAEDPAQREKYPNGMFIDVSNLDAVRAITLPTPEMSSWGLGRIDNFPALIFPGITGTIVDARGNRAIAHGAYTGHIRLYDISSKVAPKLIRVLPTWNAFSKLTSVGAIVLLGGPLTSPDLVLYSTEENTFDASVLRATYERSNAEYRECLSNPGSAISFCSLVAPPALADAGADRLLTERPPGIGEAERVLILNDYGFWLSKSRLIAPLANGETPHGVEVLRKVVELAPRRFLAWLNLGDALVGAIQIVPHLAQKQAFALEAEHAFDMYRRLTGETAANASVAAELRNRKNFPDNVCSYVADAFQAGRLNEISLKFGKIERGDRTTDLFTVRYEGTARVPQILYADGSQIRDDFSVPGERLWGNDLVRIVPYDGVSYVVYVQGGTHLASVAQPNAGPTCGFEYLAPTKRLVTNSLPAVCKRFIDGGPLDEVPAVRLGKDEIFRAETSLHHEAVTFGAIAALEFDGTPATVGKFGLSSGGGAGCDFGGIAFVADRRLESSPRNKALLDAQAEVNDCRSTDASAVVVDGKTFFEIMGMTGPNKAAPTRRLFSLKGDRLDLACRIDTVTSVVPR